MYRLPGAAGYLAATGLFVVLVLAAGGVSMGDLWQAAIPTMAVSHGQLRCMSAAQLSLPWSIAPVYPLISGSMAAVVHVGTSSPFPHLKGTPTCAVVVAAWEHWFLVGRVQYQIVRFAWLVWPVALLGVATYLRTTDRRNTRWEPAAALLTAACLPAVACLSSYFHPEGLLAIGPALVALACVRRDRWALSGVFVALASLSQQSAWLVALVMFVIVPRDRLARLFVGFLGASALVMFPLVVFGSRRALVGLLGAGFSQTSTDTWIGIWNPKGGVLWVASRLAPFVVTALVALWARRRLGTRVFGAGELAALVCFALTTRLVFEGALFDYYFMAVAIMLVVLDCARGHLRALTIAWLLLVSIAFDPYVSRGAPLLHLSYLPLEQIVVVGVALFLSLSVLVQKTSCEATSVRDGMAAAGAREVLRPTP